MVVGGGGGEYPATASSEGALLIADPFCNAVGKILAFLTSKDHKYVHSQLLACLIIKLVFFIVFKVN